MIKAESLKVMGQAFGGPPSIMVGVKGQPNCPAHSASGVSPGRCLWEVTAQATQQQQQVMEAEWRLPQSMFAVLLWQQRQTSIEQLWPEEPFPDCQTPADVKAGISPPRQEAAGRQNRLAITFFNPPADAHAPFTSSNGQVSPTKLSILLKDLFGNSIVMDENLIIESCYQRFSFSALTRDAIIRSGASS